MNFVFQPWHLILMAFAGLVNRQQQEVIEYLRTENQVLKEKLGKKRIFLNDDQRRRLAVKGTILGRRRLDEIGTLFTPDTILRWHRRLVAKKWDYSDRRKSVGRPITSKEIVQLVLRFARKNPLWGSDKIQRALDNLGHVIYDQTVGNILKEHGIEPAGDRKLKTTWKTFLKDHWDVLASIDVMKWARMLAQSNVVKGSVEYCVTIIVTLRKQSAAQPCSIRDRSTRWSSDLLPATPNFRQWSANADDLRVRRARSAKRSAVKS